MKRISTIVVFGMLALPLLAQAGHRIPHACRQCGCSHVRKVCRLVPETKKVEKTVYDVKCEDFCVNGRSKCVGTQQVCDAHGRLKCEPIMQPTCDCIRTRVKLTKKTETKEKKGWKCVVETVCCSCGVAMNQSSHDASEAEMQLALDEAERRGILTPEAVEAVETPDDREVIVALAEENDTGSEASTSAPATTEVKKASFLGSLFGR